MNMNDIALHQNPGFSFKALIAALFQLRLRDKLSAASQDHGGAVHWGM
jgi:hypothetical protein